MGVETIGEAYSLGWRVSVRCSYGREDGPSSKSSRRCLGRAELDIESLVWTRGRAFREAVTNWPGYNFKLRKGLLLIREYPERPRR